MPNFQPQLNGLVAQVMQNLKVEEFILIIQWKAIDYGSRTHNL